MGQAPVQEECPTPALQKPSIQMMNSRDKVETAELAQRPHVSFWIWIELVKWWGRSMVCACGSDLGP